MSLRRYATIEEVQELADVVSTDDAEFEDRISQAEELIDAYVGYQQPAVKGYYVGKPTSVAGTTLYDTSSNSPLRMPDNYYTYCVIEIIGGTGSGQQRKIDSSNHDNQSVTVTDSWDTNPDTTSMYKIYQVGKFPRLDETYYDPDSESYFRSIPQAIKRATAAQVEFIINQGDQYFQGDDTSKESESIGDYSYTRGGGGSGGQSSAVRMIGPKARTLLRGYKKLTGTITVDNPTNL
jgi:hypothetical protein